MEYDDSVFNSNTTSMNEVAEAIRRKKYGKDVREAMARGFELTQGTYELALKVKKALEELRQLHTEYIEKVNKRFDQLNDYIQQVEKQHNEDVQRVESQHRADVEKINQHFERIEKHLSDHDEELKNLHKGFALIDNRVAKLEEAVFGINTVEITSPVKPDNSDIPMIEINTDDRKENNNGRKE